MAELAQCGIPAKFRAQALGHVPPGLWIYPMRGPGSLGSCSYFSLPGRQTDSFVRAGEPDAHRDLWQYYQEVTRSFGDTFHLDLVHRRCSHSHQTYHGEDFQWLGDGQVTTTEQGQASHGVGVRCSPKASPMAYHPHQPALGACLALTHFLSGPAMR